MFDHVQAAFFFLGAGPAAFALILTQCISPVGAMRDTDTITGTLLGEVVDK